MIHSTFRANQASWVEPASSPNAGNNSFECQFSTLSLSSGVGGNRPPALSVSSISSIGEDTSWQKGYEYNQLSSGNSAFTFAPSSPQPHSPHQIKSMSLSSPIVGRDRDRFSKISQVEETSENNRSAFNDYLQESFSFEIKREHSSSSCSSRPLKDSSDEESLWASLHGNSSTSINNSGSQNKIRSVHSDVGDWTGSHDNMLKSPGRSTHSLYNIGSVDENEQYLGSRGRPMSAGYRNINNSFGETSMNGDNLYSFSHQSNIPPENNMPPSPRSHQAVHGNSGEAYSFRPDPNIFQENVVYSNRRGNMDVNAMNQQYLSPRQRVHSADSIYRPDFNNMHQQQYHGAHKSMGQSPTARKAPGGQRVPVFHEINDTNHNRPRAHSAGAKFLRSPKSHQFRGNGHTNNPTTVGRHDANGRMFPQKVHANEGHYPMLPSNQSTSISEQEHFIHLNARMFHSVSEPNSPRPHNVNGVDSFLFYQNHGAVAGSGPRVIYTVKFKRSQKNFILNPHIHGDIKIGTHVKVEADRGEDLGVILSRVPAEKFNRASSRYGNSESPSSTNMSMPDMKRILRVATNDEITLLRIKEEEEDELLKICRGKTLQRALPMNVVDAEYQFDRHKLTFFFEAEGRIDFRELVRELFSIYKTRIWMQQIDKNITGTVGNAVATATSACSDDSSDAYALEKTSSKNEFTSD
mmetsp:Transcript_509/g.573  ORF Transcript_509/g.573 Transcript_509/m.573 type:complete len:692 (+) Transcript_509:74-2149(+)